MVTGATAGYGPRLKEVMGIACFHLLANLSILWKRGMPCYRSCKRFAPMRPLSNWGTTPWGNQLASLTALLRRLGSCRRDPPRLV